MSLAIRAVGTALPPHTVSQSRVAELARTLCCRTERQAAMIPRLYGNAGIDTRHFVIGDDVVGDIINGTNESQSVFVPSSATDDQGPSTGERMACYAEAAPPLAVRAARTALERADLPAADVSHLVTVSCTGFMAPGVDVELIKQLRLPATVLRTHVGFMGCHGAINGLRVAQALVDAQPQACVLLCAVELCSLHFHYGWDPKKNVAGALFADGAAAVVGLRADPMSTETWAVLDSRSCLFPDAEDAMTWHIGDHGFEMSLSARVPGLIASSLRSWLAGWLAEHGLTIADVGSWAVHPGGPKILSAVEECLGLRHDALAASRAVLAECGNMSSPTVLFILERLQREQARRPCVALGFGPGLVAEAALLR